MECIIEYDFSISYTPGKANVMVDALSHKSYFKHLQVWKVHTLLHEEFSKMNLHVVNERSLNNMVTELDLKGDIKTIQHYNDDV